MAMIDGASDTGAGPAAGTPDRGIDAPGLRWFVFALFFIFGGITSLNDVIIPKLKELFTLSYGRALLVQSAFFCAYFVFSVPGAAIVRRLGYLRSATIGLLVMMAGCLAFVPASASAVFGVFLLALFVLAGGIALIQVVANPLVSLLGAPATASSRLTFAQAFNSLGTTIFPYVGSILILGSLAKVRAADLDGAALAAYRVAETRVVVHTYVALAIALAGVAAAVWLRRDRLREVQDQTGTIFHAFTLLARPRFAFGTLCIFLYVGAEVSVGSLIVGYLGQASTLGLDAQSAGKHVPFYWGGALIGRFAGAGLLRFAPPGRVLTCFAAAAVALILVSANSTGALSAWTLLAIGLANSIMFPTIFSLASAGLGARAAEGSGVLSTAIVGGAFVPPLAGHVADLAGLSVALAVPATCYAVIAAFGVFAARLWSTEAPSPGA